MTTQVAALRSDADLGSSVPERWGEVLLVEDNSARAERRKIAGVASPGRSARVAVRVHRVRSTGRSIAAETTYRAGALRKRSREGGKAAVALALIDGIAARRKNTIVAAGPAYGSNTKFLEGLANRGIEFAVEVRPSTWIYLVGSAPTGDSRVAAAQLLGSPAWRSIDITVPGAAAPILHWIAPLGDVRLPDGRVGRLFAAQIGGIPDVHGGTIIGLSSDASADLGDLLRVLGWARWIRPATRRDERKLKKRDPVVRRSEAQSSRRVNGTQLEARANISHAGRVDHRTARHRPECDARIGAGRGVLASLSPVLNVVELFAGAGGMGLGFLLAGGRDHRYRIAFSGEVNPIYVETLRSNHAAIRAQRRGDRADDVPEGVAPIDLRTPGARDRLQASARSLGGVHVLIGGPPCQGFSNANRNSWSGANPHNRMVSVFLGHVERLRPAVFVLENVQGILWTPGRRRSAGSPAVLGHLARRMAAAGYEVFPKLLDAVWYGVPQYRSRFFLVGLRRDLGYHRDDFGEWGPYPLPTHGPGAAQSYVTVRDAIGDLPSVGNGEDAATQPYETPLGDELRKNAFLRQMRSGADRGVVLDHVTSRHADYVIRRYQCIPEGGNWEDIADKLTNYSRVERTHSNIYRRLKWTEPSITIGHYRKSMLVHPTEHRGLSLREASRLQSFPDWFRFSGAVGGGGGLVHKQQQLANAVCPLVTKALADFLLEL